VADSLDHALDERIRCLKARTTISTASTADDIRLQSGGTRRAN
jgi:hypothetical protein